MRERGLDKDNVWGKRKKKRKQKVCHELFFFLKHIFAIKFHSRLDDKYF